MAQAHGPRAELNLVGGGGGRVTAGTFATFGAVDVTFVLGG